MENEEVSKELLDKVSAAKALVTVHSLLSVGMFQFRHQDELKKGMEFLTALHKQVLDECLFHPQADQVPDIVDYKAEQDKQRQMADLLATQSQAEGE